MEALLTDAMFEAPELPRGARVVVDEEAVNAGSARVERGATASSVNDGSGASSSGKDRGSSAGADGEAGGPGEDVAAEVR
jgi:hypothetical protein